MVNEMRLLGMDSDGGWHVMDVSDVYYDFDKRKLKLTIESGEEYSVYKIDRYSAEELIKTLYEEGKAELSLSFRIA